MITRTAEGAGYVLTCECQWTRFYATRIAADHGAAEHPLKCKGPKDKPAPKPARPTSRAKWDDREGATWIDSL